MNRRGFTLVEVLVAASVFVMMLVGCGYLFRTSAGYLGRDANELYRSRSCLERARALSFDQLTTAAPSGVIITPVSSDLYLIKAGPLYTLRSKY